MYGVVWWAGYTVIAVWLMHFFPGMDFLAPGFLVSLQQERRMHTAWLGSIWVLLMEGTGCLPFGFAVSWFGFIMILFFFGGWLFDRKSLAFVACIGLASGVAKFLLVYVLLHLDDMHHPASRALVEAALHVALFPLLWYGVFKVFPERLRHDERPA